MYDLCFESALPVFLADVDTQVVFGEERLDFLCPLRETPAAGIEIFLVANVVGFGNTLQSVEVKMINRFAKAIAIFINDGKGGAAYILCDAYL